MRLDLKTARISNVNLQIEPGYVWLSVILPGPKLREAPGDEPRPLRALRLDPEQLKELLTDGHVELP